MDAIAAAVALMGQQQSLTRIEAAYGMMRKEQQMDRALVDLVSAEASSGTLYTDAGRVVSPVVGAQLDAVA
jgi:hypothetical protein